MIKHALLMCQIRSNQIGCQKFKNRTVEASAMDKMEKKLAEYRAKKAREAKIEQIKSKTKHFLASLVPKKQEKVAVPLQEPAEEDSFEDDLSCVSSISDEESVSCCSYVDLLYYLLWFVLWLILFVIFVEYQFGTVFLIVSGLIFMYVNTRTGPKRANEVSAYSVFNKNCESIDGTLKAEQFEREIRYGPAVVH